MKNVRWKRLLAAFGAVLGLTTAMSLVALPAHGHTGDLKAAAVCENGTYTVTFTLTLSNVPEGKTATVEARTGTDSFHFNWDKGTWSDWAIKASDVPSTESTVTWTTTLPGDTVGNGPWEYAVTTWSDGFFVESDTRVEGLTGDCGPVVVPADPGATITGKCLAESGAVLSAELFNTFTPAPNTVGTPASLLIVVDLLDVGLIEVQPNQILPLQYSFTEDSGVHTLQIFYGDELLAEKSVDSDCKKPEPTPVPKPPAAAKTLAATGSAVDGTLNGLLLAGVLALVGGIGFAVVARKRRA